MIQIVSGVVEATLEFFQHASGHCGTMKLCVWLLNVKVCRASLKSPSCFIGHPSAFLLHKSSKAWHFGWVLSFIMCFFCC